MLCQDVNMHKLRRSLQFRIRLHLAPVCSREEHHAGIGISPIHNEGNTLLEDVRKKGKYMSSVWNITNISQIDTKKEFDLGWINIICTRRITQSIYHQQPTVQNR